MVNVDFCTNIEIIKLCSSDGGSNVVYGIAKQYLAEDEECVGVGGESL